MVALASKLTLIAASGDRCRGAVLVAVVGVIFNCLGSRVVWVELVVALYFYVA